MGTHQRVTARRARKRRRPWTLVLVSALTGVVLAECGLRVLDLPRTDNSLAFLGGQGLGPDIYEEDDRLFWRLRPEATGNRINELGLRGFLPDSAKGDRDFRVVCVGDSCTFGSGVRYEETYGIRLERLIQGVMPFQRVETVLGGVPGYSTHQDRLLFEEHILPLQPDLTVLYCGGWNDFLPAIGLTDRERSAWRDGLLSSLHLARLFQRLVWGRVPDRESYAQALMEGKAPDGRRVSLVEFRENMAWMIRRAIEVGSAVVLVVPPLTEKATQDVPIALEYRRAVRDLAREHGIPLVDTPRLFDQYRMKATEGWNDLPTGEWPCLRDWVHPSVMGHAVLADELFRVLRDQLPVAGEPEPPGRLTIASLSPGSLQPLIDNRLEVRGTGFSQPDAFDRVWLGDWSFPEVELIDDQRLELVLPRTIPPGEYYLEFSTATGPVRSEAAVSVEPPELAAEMSTEGDTYHFEVTSTGPAGWPITIWFASSPRSEPAQTVYGPFHLDADPDGRPAGFPETPFYFERLELLQVPGVFDPTGSFRLRQELPRTALEGFPNGVFIQAVIGNPDVEYDAVLSRLVSLPVPR